MGLAPGGRIYCTRCNGARTPCLKAPSPRVFPPASRSGRWTPCYVLSGRSSGGNRQPDYDQRKSAMTAQRWVCSETQRGERLDSGFANGFGIQPLADSRVTCPSPGSKSHHYTRYTHQAGNKADVGQCARTHAPGTEARRQIGATQLPTIELVGELGQSLAIPRNRQLECAEHNLAVQAMALCSSHPQCARAAVAREMYAIRAGLHRTIQAELVVSGAYNRSAADWSVAKMLTLLAHTPSASSHRRAVRPSWSICSAGCTPARALPAAARNDAAVSRLRSP